MSAAPMSGYVRNLALAAREAQAAIAACDGATRRALIEGMAARLQAGQAGILAANADDMMRAAAEAETPIMCFVGNHGAIQIHTGPVKNIQPMGPWINVLDSTFHMHLRMDHIAECWVVRKPTTDGHVTSLEAYDASGEMIIQFFGKRKEGMVERPDWREILANLPRPDSAAA